MASKSRSGILPLLLRSWSSATFHSTMTLHSDHSEARRVCDIYGAIFHSVYWNQEQFRG